MTACHNKEYKESIEGEAHKQSMLMFEAALAFSFSKSFSLTDCNMFKPSAKPWHTMAAFCGFAPVLQCNLAFRSPRLAGAV